MDTLARFEQTTPDAASRRYVIYLVIVALSGWALASYDLNLLVLLLPQIAKSMNLTESQVGLLGVFVFLAQFIITLCAGYAMDQFGRRRVWMVCLSLAAIFTGLTYFVQNFAELALIRALASGMAFSELAVSITIVNEQVPAKNRGLLYSVVQGGWPLGVFLAAGVDLMFGHLGWRVVFLLGVVPIILVIAGRSFIHESERFEHLRKVRRAHGSHDDAELATLLRQHDVDVTALDRVTISQLFATPGYVRRQVITLTTVWLFYSISYVATNFYITYWLTKFKGFSSVQASTLLLVSGGIGFFFYIIGGWLGEKFGRSRVMVVSGILIAPLNLLFLYLHNFSAVCIVYFLIYQATNGTWSGAGYAYQGESFPTRVRGTAIGFLSAMQVLGFLLGTLLWTYLIGAATPTITWWIIAIGFALGIWTTLLLKPIPPGQELEKIAA
jgi:MFS family permease